MNFKFNRVLNFVSRVQITAKEIFLQSKTKLTVLLAVIYDTLPWNIFAIICAFHSLQNSFNPEELRTMVEGNEDYDFSELEKVRPALKKKNLH